MARSDSEVIKERFQLADEFLKAAEDNLELGHLRVAAHNAYYAMFHAVTAALLTKGKKDIKSHSALIQLFGQEFVKIGLVGVEMSQLLREAFDLRQQSDYEIAAALDEHNLEQVVERAKEFVKKIKETLGIA